MTRNPGRDRAKGFRAGMARALALAVALGGLQGFALASPGAAPAPTSLASSADPRAAWLQRVESLRAAWRDRSAPAPTLEEIANRVADERRMEQALLARTGAPLDPAAIAREWNRMVERSRDPAHLFALAEALEFDRLALVETLARPALVERRLRAWWESQEDAAHPARDEIATLRSALAAGELDPRAPHLRRQQVLYLPAGCPAALQQRDDALRVDDPSGWRGLRTRW
ncbi:MAG: hypothetical protein MUC67_13215, partial [Acidobacteria bacterium]|nr:hypothetical protein [Acidobacteriota bacterium]